MPTHIPFEGDLSARKLSQYDMVKLEEVTNWQGPPMTGPEGLLTRGILQVGPIRPSGLHQGARAITDDDHALIGSPKPFRKISKNDGEVGDIFFYQKQV